MRTRVFDCAGRLAAILLSLATVAAAADRTDWRDPSQPADARAAALVAAMTLEEKAAQAGHTAPAIPRLGVPEYNWWNEGLHGVARAGRATVFPQAIGLAASWDTKRMHEVADVISTEFRAKYLERAAREWRQRLVSRAHRVVAQHQHFPRSALGPRTGDLWRGSIPHRADRRRFHQGPAR